MENIDKENIKNAINGLIFKQTNKRYILKCLLDTLNLTDEELEYVISYINKSKINIVNYEVIKKDRTTSVAEYDYGYFSGYEI